jgi:hypothetical protein
MVTGPFGASMVTGNPSDSGIVVDDVVLDELAVVVPSVVVGASSVSDDDPHAATMSAIATNTVRILRDMMMLLSREEPS